MTETKAQDKIDVCREPRKNSWQSFEFTDGQE
jgi:hypothetical protein